MRNGGRKDRTMGREQQEIVEGKMEGWEGNNEKLERKMKG